MSEARARAPWHLWVVGILSTLWGLLGIFDYLATELKLDFYMSQFSQEQLDYFYSAPAWMIAAWALAVWCGLAGSLCLLLRKRWAVPLFVVSFLGLAVSTLYNFVLTDATAIMGTAMAYFTVVIWIVAILLLVYARAMAKKGVLA